MQLTLKEARERKGWSLAEVEAKTGLNKSTISRIERGLVRPSHDTVLALQDAFKLRAGALVFPVAA